MRTLLAASLVVLLMWGARANQPAVQESPHGDLEADCALCHSMNEWKPIQLRSDFDHARFGPRLVGAHEDLYCGFCHQQLDFKGLDGGCTSCHVDAHSGELGPDCEQCHGFESFSATSDQRRMHRSSSFPLSGAHLGVPCDRCHPPEPVGGNTYRLTDSSCIACHQDSYELVAEPDHQSAGFDTSCERCHRDTSWDDAAFDHSQVRATPCVDCHLEEYNQTNDPDHLQAGFSMECQNCHNTHRWGDGRFDHGQWFPIYSGKHREEWNSCNDCHINPSSYMEFSCLGCHPHSNRRDTDDKHDGLNDYAYDSIECYRCHPDGRED